MNEKSFAPAVIGRVSNTFETHEQLHQEKDGVSEIVIKEDFADGLFRLDESKYIQVLFRFDRSEGYMLKTPTFDGEVRGVFASRSPKRPAGIGVTTVELLGVEGRTLTVRGLDALNNTPVIDIKPYSAKLDDACREAHEMHQLRHAPRSRIRSLIRKNDREALLTLTGTFHGHYCPGISLGVLAATELMRRCGDTTDGLEDTIAVVETNSCFSDAIQYVTGCTFGNNSLVYRDLGKTACSLVGRSGKGIRASVAADFRQTLQKDFPEYFSLFEKVICRSERDEETVLAFKRASMEASFAMLDNDISELLHFTDISIELPGYAPIVETLLCRGCGEGFMATRSGKDGDLPLCITCAKAKFGELNGAGITSSDAHVRRIKEE